MFLFKRKNGYWYVGYYENKRRINKSSGKRNKTEANEFFRSFKQKKSNPVTYLSEHKTDCLKYAERNLSYKSHLAYRLSISHLIRIAGDKPLSMYMPKDIEKYKNDRIDEGVTMTTVNIELRTLKAIFNLAIKWLVLEVNPLKEVKQFRIPETVKKTFTVEEINIIANNISHVPTKQITLFAYYSGMRINEILHLQNSDVKDNVIMIRNKTGHLTKSRRIREIPLTDKLKEILSQIAIHDIEGYFWKFGKHGAGYISSKFKKTLRKLNMQGNFHCLRHSYATFLNKKGIGIYDIQKLLGHSNIATTEIYLHSLKDGLREQLNEIQG